mmetsp:Transcript_278/g.302  ORF Transcript_278/g.302 Transcript_278/m.302 type:complete len:286 (-) Transcript_278:210-1067(-)
MLHESSNFHCSFAIVWSIFLCAGLFSLIRAIFRFQYEQNVAMIKKDGFILDAEIMSWGRYYHFSSLRKALELRDPLVYGFFSVEYEVIDETSSDVVRFRKTIAATKEDFEIFELSCSPNIALYALKNNPRSASLCREIPDSTNEVYWGSHRWILLSGNAVLMMISLLFSISIFQSFTNLFIVVGSEFGLVALIFFLCLGVHKGQINQLLNGAKPVTDSVNTKKFSGKNSMKTPFHKEEAYFDDPYERRMILDQKHTFHDDYGAMKGTYYENEINGEGYKLDAIAV